jgi:class 3 adenylate cyclase
MFIDRHDAPGLTPEEVAEAHERDVAVQERYGVVYRTYWFDPDNGSVFCLAEGPSREAVEDVHREAHDQTAYKVIEIDERAPLNEFFGSLPVHPPGTPYSAPGMRAIVFTDVCGSVAQTEAWGDDGHMEVLTAHNEIVRRALGAHGGREVKHTGDGVMAAFTSIAAAVGFAIDAQRGVEEHNRGADRPFAISIGISAGEPVTDGSDDLFGAAVQLAARLCDAAAAGEIVTSLAVRELSVGKTFRFEDREPLTLKGLREPASVFAVRWRGEPARPDA